MRKLLALLILLAGCAADIPVEPSGDDFVITDVVPADASAVEPIAHPEPLPVVRKPVRNILLFTATWCRPGCPLAKAHAQASGLTYRVWTGDYTQKSKIWEVDVDQYQPLVRTFYKTDGRVPAYVLLEDGKKVKELVGPLSADQVLDLFEGN